MRVALAQINPTLGDFDSNSEKILEYAKRAKEKHADVVVFPEACLFGYHPMDLLERASIVKTELTALKTLIKKFPKDLLVIFGAFTINENKRGKPYHNSAVVALNGKIIKSCAKELLPTYNVFDDARHIEPGDLSKNILKFKGKKILVTVCEDIWAWSLPGQSTKNYYDRNPLKKIRPRSVDLAVNLSASPFYLGKLEQRRSVVKQTAGYLKAPVVYVNMVGAQDELIFDGGSFAVNAAGKILAQSIFFDEDLNLVDLKEAKGGIRMQKNSATENVRQALLLGIRDFCAKLKIKKVHLGLSGGIDSAVVACLAADAMGPANVSTFAMPGPYSASMSEQLAEQLAKNLEVSFDTISIQPAFDALKGILEGTLGSMQINHAEENLQARLRGIVLMAYANREGSLLLNTTNKDELAAGYGTLYGDMTGGLCVVGDLVKKDVYELAEYYNRESEIIPRGIIDRAPTAELKPNQTDQDTLPPYDALDKAVVHLIEEMKPAKSSAEKFLLNALLKSEFKRWQAPPVLKVKIHSFGRGRRMPVAHRASD